MAAGQATGKLASEAIERGVNYLLATQQPDGTWDEAEFTGTGFPGHFYLKYHLYQQYFPLIALGRHQALLGRL
jgi:squalene-hopene/tetraprenyl-beta-curcumene cyclase